MNWIPLHPPKPKDEEVYTIRLKSGEIIKDVEFWAHGGGFEPQTQKGLSDLTRYPLFLVEAFLQEEMI